MSLQNILVGLILFDTLAIIALLWGGTILLDAVHDLLTWELTRREQGSGKEGK